MNKPTQSKINYTALIMAVLTLLTVYDIIPAAAQEPVMVIVGLVGPALVATFRTWYTDKT